jgi:hypothetical protein
LQEKKIIDSWCRDVVEVARIARHASFHPL